MLDILISYFLFHNFNTGGGGVTLMDIQKEQNNLNYHKHL